MGVMTTNDQAELGDLKQMFVLKGSMELQSLFEQVQIGICWGHIMNGQLPLPTQAKWDKT